MRLDICWKFSSIINSRLRICAICPLRILPGVYKGIHKTKHGHIVAAGPRVQHNHFLRRLKQAMPADSGAAVTS